MRKVRISNGRLIPKGVLDITPSERMVNTFHGKCPNCGELVMRVTDRHKRNRYCPVCGQAIVWPE